MSIGSAVLAQLMAVTETHISVATRHISVPNLALQIVTRGLATAQRDANSLLGLPQTPRV